MAFSNLGSHNVLGPSRHWAALPVKFCASKSLLVLRISWCSYSLPLVPVLYFSVRGIGSLPFYSVLPPTILTWWPCIWETAAWSFSLHSVSKRTCFLCLHPTASPHPFSYSPAFLGWACVYLPRNPALSGLSSSPFKILPLPLLQ